MLRVKQSKLNTHVLYLVSLQDRYVRGVIVPPAKIKHRTSTFIKATKELRDFEVKQGIFWAAPSVLRMPPGVGNSSLSIIQYHEVEQKPKALEANQTVTRSRRPRLCDNQDLIWS